MREGPHAYGLEQHLVADFLWSLCLDSYVYGITGISTEFNYQSGRTDIVARTFEGEIIAFEAKLTRWKVALNQAYRNRCFAHRSFVVLPERTAHIALKNSKEFVSRNVGIVAVSGQSHYDCVLEASVSHPCLGWLTQKALAATTDWT